MSIATSAFKGVYEIGKGIAGYALYEKATDYVFDKVPSTPVNKPEYSGQPPVSKPQSANTIKTSTKGQKAVALGTLLAGALGTYEQVVNDAKSSSSTLQSVFETLSSNNEVKTQALLTPSLASPLLSNQVFTKASIDSIVDALNANTLMSSILFSTLDVNLSNIASSLYAVSSTLFTISNNYEDEINNTGDIPFINTDDYYKMLSDNGMSLDEVNTLKNNEIAYIESMRNSGVSYSDMKKALISWRNNNISSSVQNSVNDTIAGVKSGWHANYTTIKKVSPSGEVVNELVPTSSSSSVSPVVDLKVPNLEKWAESAFNIQNSIGVDIYARDINARMVKNEYAINESSISDLDGNLLATVRPMEAHAIKSITEARLRTDMNNYRDDEDDIDFSLIDGLDLSELFTFDKKSVRLEDLKNALGIV